MFKGRCTVLDISKNTLISIKFKYSDKEKTLQVFTEYYERNSRALISNSFRKFLPRISKENLKLTKYRQ